MPKQEPEWSFSDEFKSKVLSLVTGVVIGAGLIAFEAADEHFDARTYRDTVRLVSEAAERDDDTRQLIERAIAAAGESDTPDSLDDLCDGLADLIADKLADRLKRDQIIPDPSGDLAEPDTGG